MENMTAAPSASRRCKPHWLDSGMASVSAARRRQRLLVAACRARYFSGKGRRAMMSTVIGGAMLPHALQFFTMPETEDKAVVAHVREVAADIGSRLPQEQREALVKLDLPS